jgi:hypothetical protein
MTARTPLPPELDQPEVLAFIAALLVWRDGDPTPLIPKQLTISVAALLAMLSDERVRRGVAERLMPALGVRPRGRRR